jgi:acyl-CoA synthetase (AMP-forming)/AMP-acid ligase II
MNIPFILEKALSLFGDREAVVCGEARFTYKEFADRVYRLANFLRSSGVGQGDCIAILHQNSHEFLETYFATAQVGAILNPLNYRLSPNELAFILRDSGASLLIASDRFVQSVEPLLEMEIDLNQVLWTGSVVRASAPFESMYYEEVLREEKAVAPRLPDISDDDVVHLYYTSGTTGRPKGVMLSHKNVCVHALAAVAELKLGDHDNWIHVAPLFHLADAWATFAITWVGGKHVVVPDFDPPLVLSAIEQ